MNHVNSRDEVIEAFKVFDKEGTMLFPFLMPPSRVFLCLILVSLYLSGVVAGRQCTTVLCLLVMVLAATHSFPKPH